MSLRKVFYTLFSWLAVFAGTSLLLWFFLIPWYRADRHVYGKEIITPLGKPSATANIPTTDPWEKVTEDLTTVKQEVKMESFPFARLWERDGEPERLWPFLLTIESLGIEKAKVTAAVDPKSTAAALFLEQSLIHLKDSAYPGEEGNAVILGHSSLPLLFRGNNYKTIFANLSELAEGEVVKIIARGEELSFRVEEKRLISPTKDPRELSVGSGKTLTLVTCFPPGLTRQRLVVILRLQAIRQLYPSLEKNKPQ